MRTGRRTVPGRVFLIAAKTAAAAGFRPVERFQLGLRLRPDGAIGITAEEFFQRGGVRRAVDTVPGHLLFGRRRRRLFEVSTVEHNRRICLEGTWVCYQFLITRHEP